MGVWMHVERQQWDTGCTGSKSGHLKASLAGGLLEVASRDSRKPDTQEETV